MFKHTTKQKGINELKALALENGNGIYIIYADHLNSDAVIVFTVENGTIKDETELDPYGGAIDNKFKTNYLPKHPLLQVYGFTVAWFTFPLVWDKDETFIKKYVYEPVTLLITAIED